MGNFVTTFAAELGVLRVALACVTLTAVVLATPPGTEAVYTGWDFVPTVLLPVLAPLILMVLLLDTMMSAIFMIEKEIEERRRYRRIMIANLSLVILLIVRWLPFFMAL
jgi:hypothetical protein